MGTVISMSEWRQRRRCDAPAPTPPPARRAARSTFLFDLASPWTYLAAERVDRLFPDVRWRPASGEALAGGVASDTRQRRVRDAVERRADELQLPVVWPEAPSHGHGAMRVASLAAERGCAAPFVLAATRLAFCGGYDLDHPEILAEAAAAADLELDAALRAAGDAGRDVDLERAAQRLAGLGASELPALIVGRLLFAGERRMAEAAAAVAGPIDERPRRAQR